MSAPNYIKVTAAKHISDYCIEITFSDGAKKTIDFEKPFKKYLKGDYLKWLKPINFKRFKVDMGNIVWGKNWDVIFPVDQLHQGRIK